VRLLSAWEDFRARWSSKDASGTGLQWLAGGISPVVLVGVDQKDGAGVNLWGSRHVVAGGLFGHTRLEAPPELEAGVWVARIRAGDASAAARFFARVVRYDDPMTPFGVGGQQLASGPAIPYLRHNQLADLNPPVAATEASVPPDEWVEFPGPGLLIGPPGFGRGWGTQGLRLEISCDTAGDDYTTWVLFRSA
jgi:hypothetical protein